MTRDLVEEGIKLMIRDAYIRRSDMTARAALRSYISALKLHRFARLGTRV